MRAISAAGAIAAVFVTISAQPAHADDPAAVEAADGNLESTEERQGMIFSLGIGGGFAFGLGLDDSTGTGGGGLLRLGRVASRRAVVGIEGTAFTHISRENVGPVMPRKIELYRRDATTVLAFGQFYVSPVLWVRAGIGLGRYAGDELRSEANILLRERVRVAGPAGSAGAGLDVIKIPRFRLGIELMTTGILTREGLVAGNAFLIDLTFD